jgi:N-acetylmuramoyl-L-alanine amidase
MKKINYTFLLLMVTFIACITVKKPYEATNRDHKRQLDAYMKLINEYPLRDTVGYMPPPFWVGTTNFGIRKPNFVIIHHTAQDSCEQTLRTFTIKRTQVSAHYVICRSGIVYHMLNDYLRAQHAGVGRWGNVTDMNSQSIGIELDNNGSEPFTEPMMESLEKLLENLKKTYNIPTANFIGHADWAPIRKNDPSIYFDWKRMADKGFGVWYSDTTGLKIPTNFNNLHAFRIIGYDIKDSTAVIRQFNQKFLKEGKTKTLTEGGRKVLYSLMMKFL